MASPSASTKAVPTHKRAPQRPGKNAGKTPVHTETMSASNPSPVAAAKGDAEVSPSLPWQTGLILCKILIRAYSWPKISDQIFKVFEP